MSRPAKYDRDAMLDTAAALLRAGGVRAVTMTAVAETLGAPSGSVYHRFSGRDALLAELWLRTVERFQAGFLHCLDRPSATGAVEAALTHLLAWVDDNPDEAHLLLLHRRADLAEGEWPDEVRRRVRRLGREFDRAVLAFAERLPRGRREAERAAFVLVDLPMAAVRRHLAEGRRVPALTRTLLLDSARALVAG